MKSAGIYIHIPFCAVKCNYCDFYSITDRKDSVPRFIDAVVKEIQKCTVDVSNWNLDTIFIGGGTPSLLNANDIESILLALETKYNLTQIKEFTIEANPGESPLERLRDFRSLGINRLSIGVQSLEPKILTFLTRIHSADQAFNTYENARTAGFENINCDLIYAIPGQSWKIWERDLTRILNLNPEHISAYILTLEKGTELYKFVKKGSVSMPKQDHTAEWFLNTQNILRTNSYSAYEISNYAKPGMECLHNQHYWRIHPYLAFGPSAHGFDGKIRWNNFKSLDKYLKQIESGKIPVSTEESLTEKNLINELIGFGLRMKDGINLIRIPKKYLKIFSTNLISAEKKWKDFLIINNTSVSLTEKGMVYADSICVDLLL
ncbi:MAG: coproporphyrinogen III oxidase [Candidatus Marinimicrobia bacterium]|nr:coproporphyrinogen III oxidase [Candidatus Neomarinimicrobiota bacterium]|tara:strand:+ start:64989 stop:66119 length:1131 start_codon:yes stop_codon:yes gene_type:complete